MKFKQFFIWAVPSFVLSFIFFGIWLDPVKQAFFNLNYWSALIRFGESLRVTNIQYVEENKSDYSQLTDFAINGMVVELDRHSSYYTPNQYDSFKDDTHRRYVGIGIMIRKVEEGILITRVFPGGPAEEAGLTVGEFIVQVEGETLTELDLGQVSNKIKGESDTSVSIKLRSLSGAFRVLNVNRKKISISSVEGVEVDENGIGYLRLVQFSARSAEEFEQAVKRLLDQGMNRLIVDLRDNAGGLLSAAVEVSDLFLPENQLIVSIKGRNQKKIRNFKSNSRQVIPQIPILLLMNGGSASASEILGGALSVLGRAKIVGEKSFGKGSVQTVFPMDNGAGLRLTTAMYYLPDGSTIHEEGINPDYFVDFTDENDTKLRIQRYGKDIMSREDFEKQFGFSPVRDLQLEKAKELLLSQNINIEN